MATKSDKDGSSSSGEITAEWIVKAQLKITQPKKKAASFGSGDCGARRSTGSPYRNVYKWKSDGKSEKVKKVCERKARLRFWGKINDVKI